MFFFRSIKNQLGLLSVAFILFISLALIQFYYSYSIQKTEMQNLKFSHKIISDYLALEKSENEIIEAIREFAEGTRPQIADKNVKEINQQRDDWFTLLQFWYNDLKTWQAQTGIKRIDPALSEKFVELKKRQAEAYLTAVQLCRESKNKDALSIIIIEKNFRPSVYRTVSSILDGIKLQMESDSIKTRRFYIGTTVSLFVALMMLMILSTGIFRNITVNLKHLEDGATRVAKGDFSKIIGITSPEELASLAQTFNDMQAALEIRNSRISEDHDQIRMLNESLQGKIAGHDKTIAQQNASLKRKNLELEHILNGASHDLAPNLGEIGKETHEIKLELSALSEKVSSGKLTKDDLLSTINAISDRLTVMTNAEKNVSRQIEGISKISKLGKNELTIQQLDVNEIVRKVVMQFDQKIIAEISIVTTTLEQCFANQPMIEQAFGNLIANAIKFKSPERPLSIEISSSRTQDTVRYCVADNGIGIDKNQLEKIFYIFTKGDPKSHSEGLGLAIVKRIAEIHNGTAWAESEQGKGSKFFIEIPSAPEHIRKAEDELFNREQNIIF